MTEEIVRSFRELEQKLLGQLANAAKDLPLRPNISLLKEIEAIASALLSMTHINEFYKKR